MTLTLFDLLQNQGLFRGMVVQSKAGHDKKKVFIVLKVEGCFAWLADGESRKHDNPKKKRIRHVRPLGQLDDLNELNQIESMGDPGQRDAALRKIISKMLATNPAKEEN